MPSDHRVAVTIIAFLVLASGALATILAADTRRDLGTASTMLDPLPGDADGDGVPDGLDLCPTEPALPGDADGCPDRVATTRAS
ncbi:MAG: hypothetical protein WC876_05240 [Candidatus Thermoplasmatota archaeon]|jgi:hypothetical protein